MPKKVRVGIAGCGNIAVRSHIPAFKSIKNVEVCSLYDVSGKKAAECGSSCAPGAEAFTDFTKFLNSGLDAVSVCSPTVFHYEQTMSSFRKGLHVFCEKPMADTLEKASRMISASRRAGKVLHINQSLRYTPSYLTLGELIKKGKIGDLQHMRCIRASAGDPSSPGGWAPGSSWFRSRKQGGGVLLDIGIHMADLFRWYGGPVDEIAGDVRSLAPGLSASGSAAAVFRFRSKATGVLELKWGLGVDVSLLEIYGTEGALRMGFNGADIQHIPSGGTNKAEVIKPKQAERVKNSFECFIRAARGGLSSPTPGELGRDALALCAAIQESSDSNRFVKVRKWKS